MKLSIEIKENKIHYSYETPAGKCTGSRLYSFGEMKFVCEIIQVLEEFKSKRTKSDILKMDSEMWLCRNHKDLYAELLKRSHGRPIEEQPE